ncbi:PKD domain-containing protein [Kitasatospora sp. NPDC127111]|uniref:PKD domain-containing protein n=1 Tax=Kitasatospora sp. NPDC127111 TaxID=3345363 RepID=UPI00363BE1A7
MRRARIPAAAALVLSITGALAPTTAAQAAVTDLYVDKGSAACSDTSGTAGSQGTPFCTIAAATNSVQPGQTVHIAGGDYDEELHLTRSGTSSAPITFIGARYDDEHDATVLGDRGGLSHAVSLNGVHDVVIDRLFGRSGKEGVLVADSSRVTVNDVTIYSSGWDGTPAARYPGMRITGASSDVTVRRSAVAASYAGGIQVDAGVARTVLTADLVSDSSGPGVSITDAPGTVITGNTVQGACGPMIDLAGSSGGASIENNVLDLDEGAHPVWGPCTTAGPDADLSASAGSAAGTKADYNLVTTATGTPYLWAGQSYAALAQFQQGSGQGSHDLVTSRDDLRKDNSPAVDSADADAPGELATDRFGNPRVDHPLVANTGTGSGYHDRGASEAQDPLFVSLGQSPDGTAGKPLTVKLNGSVSSPWAPATGTLDFGDGSAPVSAPAFPVSHDYAPGTYTAKLTATDGLGLTRTTSATVVVNEPGPIKPVLWLEPSWTGGQDVRVTNNGATSPWPVASYRFDFGDGTAPTVLNGTTAPDFTHYYAKPGTYNVTETVTDDHGRTASTAGTISVSTPVAGRWLAGQKSSTVAYFRGGHWTLLWNNTPSSQYGRVDLGQAGDLPVVGDWDGVGHDQVGIFRPSSNTFALRHEDGGVSAVTMGDPGDVPVPGMWDHNGHAQLAVYRPSTGLFAVRHDDGSYSSAVFGNPGDIPVVGDWDGVGHTQMGIYRPSSNTFALRHDDGSVSAADHGTAGDLPIVGDWNGLGRTTYGVYRPSDAGFHLSRAYAGQSDLVFTFQLH